MPKNAQIFLFVQSHQLHGTSYGLMPFKIYCFCNTLGLGYIPQKNQLNDDNKLRKKYHLRRRGGGIGLFGKIYTPCFESSDDIYSAKKGFFQNCHNEQGSLCVNISVSVFQNRKYGISGYRY